MRKGLVIILIASSLLLAGCSLDPNENDRQERQKDYNSCIALGSGFVFDGYFCKERFSYCTVECSDFVDRGLKNINDTWGNVGGFPEQVMDSMNQCLASCNNR